jgi:hypothetical protein
MKPGLCDENEAAPAPVTSITRRAPVVPVAVLLREAGTFPIRPDAAGNMLDPSPLAGLTAKQRRARLVGILEASACYGDTAAAAEALRHLRWEDEMTRGKAPQRVDLHQTGELRVLDTLSAPPGIPIPPRRRVAGNRNG